MSSKGLNGYRPKPPGSWVGSDQTSIMGIIWNCCRCDTFTINEQKPHTLGEGTRASNLCDENSQPLTLSLLLNTEVNAAQSQQHPKSEITPPISWSEPDDFKGRLLRKGDGGPPISETPCLDQPYPLAPPPYILPQYLPPSPSPAVAPVPFGCNQQPTSSVIRRRWGW